MEEDEISQILSLIRKEVMERHTKSHDLHSRTNHWKFKIRSDDGWSSLVEAEKFAYNTSLFFFRN